jgi:Glycosyltransferase (GlcNAc)
MQAPFKTRFLSAHFIFTSGGFARETPYDPEMYFHGEETSLAARAFTHGYDLFSPHRPVIWHEYIRKGKTKHWDDATDWGKRNDHSYARYRELFRMEETQSPKLKQSPRDFGFGAARTLSDYEKYAGIKFKTRQIHKETINGDLPPLKSDLESGLTNTIKVCIDVLKDSLPEADYDFFAVAILNEAGDDYFREDCSENEIRTLFRSATDDRFIHIWRTYNHTERPHATRVWPHSRSKGWMDKIDQLIPYE